MKTLIKTQVITFADYSKTPCIPNMKKAKMKAKAKNRWSRENIHYIFLMISRKKTDTHESSST